MLICAKQISQPLIFLGAAFLGTDFFEAALVESAFVGAVLLAVVDFFDADFEVAFTDVFDGLAEVPVVLRIAFSICSSVLPDKTDFSFAVMSSADACLSRCLISSQEFSD